MNRLLLSFVISLCLGLTAGAETTAVPNDWHRVELLKAGTSIHLQTISKKKTTCKVSSVGENELICMHGASSLKFSRDEVKLIKTEHRIRSALVGLSVGAGIGVGIGAGVGRATDSGGFLSGLGTEVGALLGGVIGGITGLAIGAPTDMTAGTVYRIR